MNQVPTIGRIVHYTLTEWDADQVNRRRDDWKDDQAENATAVGFQAHVGNRAEAGQTYPMLIVRVWGDTPESSVNGQVFLDGNDVLWVTSCSVGEGPGYFAWLGIVKPIKPPTSESGVSAGPDGRR